MDTAPCSASVAESARSSIEHVPEVDPLGGERHRPRLEGEALLRLEPGGLRPQGRVENFCAVRVEAAAAEIGAFSAAGHPRPARIIDAANQMLGEMR